MCVPDSKTFRLETPPALAAPAFIVGFRGGGNALEAMRTTAFLVETLQAVSFGHVEPDAEQLPPPAARW